MARSGHTNIQSVTPYLNAKKDETNTNINKALSNNNYPKEPIDLSINNNQLLERLEKLENENKKLKEKLENRFTGYQ